MVFFSSSTIFLFLSVSFKKVKQSQKMVSMNLHLRHTKSAASTRDIISNLPTVNTINICDIFSCTLLHRELHNTYVPICILKLRQIDLESTYFAYYSCFAMLMLLFTIACKNIINLVPVTFLAAWKARTCRSIYMILSFLAHDFSRLVAKSIEI